MGNKPTEFKRELRYLVLKLSDVKQLHAADRRDLARVVNNIHTLRKEQGRSPYVDGLVVEADWPEYEPTWKAIEERVTKDGH